MSDTKQPEALRAVKWAMRAPNVRQAAVTIPGDEPGVDRDISEEAPAPPRPKDESAPGEIRREIDRLWQQAVKDGGMFARDHFAALVAAAEREACSKLCDDLYKVRAKGGFPREASAARSLRDAIRARGQQ